MDIVKESFKRFTQNFIGSSFHMTNNVSIYKSGIDHWSMNYCFVDGEISDKDLNFIKEKFDVSGILFSKEKIDDHILEIESFHPVGPFPLMLREEVPDFYTAPVYDDMEILTVREYPMIFSDFLDVFCDIRNLNSDEIKQKINIDSLTKENHFFVAYMSDNPVGIFYAISNDFDAFIIDASVKESYRNTGVLNAMAKKAKEEALKNEILNFYSIPTSDFSVRVMDDQGYKTIGAYHFWQNVK